MPGGTGNKIPEREIPAPLQVVATARHISCHGRGRLHGGCMAEVDEAQKLQAAKERLFQALGVNSLAEVRERLQLSRQEFGEENLLPIVDFYKALVKNRVSLLWVFTGLGPMHITWDGEMTEQKIYHEIDKFIFFATLKDFPF